MLGYSLDGDECQHWFNWKWLQRVQIEYANSVSVGDPEKAHMWL